MRGNLLTLFIFFFSLSSTTIVTGTPSSQTPITPVPAQVNGVTVTTQQGYVQGSIPSTIMNDLPGFLANPTSNYCSDALVKSGKPCFVQYTVTPLSNGTYRIDNSSLQCPDTYIPVLTLGNSALDKNNPSNKILFYPQTTYYKVSPSQYNVFILKGTCSAGISYKAANTAACSWDSCSWNLGALNGSKFTNVVDSNYMLYVTGTKWTGRPTYRDHRKCTYDKADDDFGTCGSSRWCQHCDWYYYTMSYVNCTIPAGYYLYDVTNPNANNPDASHTPSTVICAKPSVKWTSTPISKPKAQQ